MTNPDFFRTDALMEPLQTLNAVHQPIEHTPGDLDDIPVLTESEITPEEMVIEISQRIEARLAEALPQLIEATVRDYLAEKAGSLAPQHF